MGFYSASVASERINTSNLLHQPGHNQNYPWLVSDDFNEILFSFEKVRGIPCDE